MGNDILVPDSLEGNPTKSPASPLPTDLLYKEVQVKNYPEKNIFKLFCSDDGRFYDNDDHQLFLGVFGLYDLRVYERERSDPRWYICESKGSQDVLMELDFEKVSAQRVTIRFIWREGKQSPAVEQFVEKLLSELRKRAKVVVIEERPSSSTESANLEEQNKEPWKEIEDHGWDRQALELWWNGYTAKEIAQKVGRNITPVTVTNRISALRTKHGENIVPKDEGRKRGHSN
jgi:hypothetical protein